MTPDPGDIAKPRDANARHSVMIRDRDGGWEVVFWRKEPFAMCRKCFSSCLLLDAEGAEPPRLRWGNVAALVVGQCRVWVVFIMMPCRKEAPVCSLCPN